MGHGPDREVVEVRHRLVVAVGHPAEVVPDLVEGHLHAGLPAGVDDVALAQPLVRDVHVEAEQRAAEVEEVSPLHHRRGRVLEGNHRIRHAVRFCKSWSSFNIANKYN